MKTRLAVIGDPIAHSLSPVIHIAVLEEMGIDYDYQKIRIPKGELLPFLRSEDCTDMLGFNLTMPHKQDVMPYLDFIDSDAQVFDAVNTVKVQDGKLLGYNTDGRGCVRAMEEKGYGCKGKRIVIFGAGGVVSTVALKAAMEEAASVVVLNRSRERAEELAKNVLLRTGRDVIIAPLETDTIREYSRECDVLINGTPLGMEGIDADFEDFSFLDELPKGALVYDLIYKPETTNLLEQAEKRGLETLNGLGMLICQGLLADEIFFETTLDVPYFTRKIKNKIKNL